MYIDIPLLRTYRVNLPVSPRYVVSLFRRGLFDPFFRQVYLDKANLLVLRCQLPKMDPELPHNPPRLDQQSNKKPENIFNSFNICNSSCHNVFCLGYVT